LIPAIRRRFIQGTEPVLQPDVGIRVKCMDDDGNPEETSPVDPVRSMIMSRIGRRDTKPEIVVRKALHARGLRFRLQAAELPGRPDIVMRPRRLAIFVHGCFWHRHEGCRLASMPKTRTDFWSMKFRRNQNRDASAIGKLVDDGWKALVIWECETRDQGTLAGILDREFGSASLEIREDAPDTGTW
jgi:DNA mismatch endonuclease (patch repair protein)